MKLYNTLSGKIEEIKTLKSNKLTIYTCGITPYDTTHLGHAFTYLSFDVLIRYFEYKNYQVNYSQNVTDINDRDNDILKRAKEQNISWQKLSDFWTDRFLSDMQALNWRKPDNYLYASEQISSMVNLIKKLLDNRIAYEVLGNVYLDIVKDKDYGKLSKLGKKEMLRIAKDYEEDIENPNKKNPLDITLWKAACVNQPAHIPSFKSEFGKGRPGWHIECSAMAMSSLGKQIDIHGGGKDLIFPHHEAEIAQSESATGKTPFSKYWAHTGIISFQDEKMSKSLGNLVLVSDLLKKYPANIIRFYLLSHKYSDDWEFKFSEIEEVKKSFLLIEQIISSKKETKVNPEHLNRFEAIIEDDLNTNKALKFIIQLTREAKNKSTIKKMLKILGFVII